MASIPRDPALDNSLALLREGYTFIGRRCRGFGSDLFETRLLLKPFVCMTGPDAARLVYDPERFERRGVQPEPVRATLLGSGGVQHLDGAEHRRRKALLLSLMTPESIGRLVALTDAAWDEALVDWTGRGSVTLMPAVEAILSRAVHEWVGAPIGDEGLERRTRAITALIGGPASIGPEHVRARVARWRLERSIGELVERVRRRSAAAEEDRPFAAIALHRSVDGDRLEPRVAAVEILNLLRPVVAVGRWIAFIAHALHRHPDWRDRLATGSDGEVTAFVHEVRRFYPFFPAIAARTRHALTWQGYRLPAGRHVLLDIYGTNRDERTWREPNRFHPERFRAWDGDAHAFIPQGGGEHLDDHRCAGEWITVDLMKLAARKLTREMRYEVPEQDLRISLRPMPTGPRSGLVISNVRRLQPSAAASTR